MNASTLIDVGAARIAHLKWTLAVEALVANPKESIEIQSHQNCALGRWIHASGLQAYGNSDAMQLLVRTHKNFHEAAHALTTNEQRDSKHLKESLGDFMTLSRDIIFYLTEIELDSLELRHKKQVIAHPVSSLMHRLFNGPHHALPDNRGPLNVSYARLLHLNWARSLTKAFRGWGHDAHLESAEDCTLGDWLRTTDASLRKKHIEINYLRATHKKFHTQAEETLMFLRRRSENAAQKSYTKTLRLSREIIYVLSLMELKLLDSGIVVCEEGLI